MAIACNTEISSARVWWTDEDSPLGSLRLLRLARSSELSSNGGFLKGGKASDPAGGEGGWISLPACSRRDIGNLSSFVEFSSLSSVTTRVTIAEAVGSAGRVSEATVPGTQPVAVSGSHTRVPLAYVAAIIAYKSDDITGCIGMGNQISSCEKERPAPKVRLPSKGASKGVYNRKGGIYLDAMVSRDI